MTNVVPLFAATSRATTQERDRYKTLAGDYAREVRRLQESVRWALAEGFVVGVFVMTLVAAIWQ